MKTRGDALYYLLKRLFTIGTLAGSSYADSGNYRALDKKIRSAIEGVSL